MPAYCNSTEGSKWTAVRQFVDEDGTSIDISGYELRMVWYRAKDRKLAFTLSVGSGITISADGGGTSSIATFEATGAQILLNGPGMARVVLWRDDEDELLAEGSEMVESLEFDA